MPNVVFIPVRATVMPAAAKRPCKDIVREDARLFQVRIQILEAVSNHPGTDLITVAGGSSTT